MWLGKVLLFLIAVLVAVPISFVTIGWGFTHPWGIGVALAFLCLVAFIHWRRRPEHLGGIGYWGLRSRVEWLREKDNLFKG
jgi:uncharacterized protein (DUF58 family)